MGQWGLRRNKKHGAVSCTWHNVQSVARALAAEPFRDPKLPLEERLNNLVSLLTLEEKLHNFALAANPLARRSTLTLKLHSSR